MFQFFTHVELSRSIVAILEMSQYVAYQKNVVYVFLSNPVQSLTVLTFCAQWMGLAALLDQNERIKSSLLTIAVNQSINN